MKDYKFYLNNDGDLCCIKTNDEMISELSGTDALKQLQEIDSCSFNHMEATRRNMEFETVHGKIHLVNYKEIMEEFGDIALIQTLPKIHELLQYNQRKKHKSEYIRNLKIASIGATVGTLAMTSLFATSYANRKNTTMDNKNVIHTEMDEPETIANDLADNTVLEIIEGDQTYLDYASARDTATGQYAYNTYYEIADTYASMWGISTNLVLALLTQESGGVDINLMQIQFFSWEDQILYPYNFMVDAKQKYVLTNHKEKYTGQDVICISEEELQNPITNISVGCILLMESFKSMDYHIGAGIQCYNLGVGNMTKILNQTALSTGVSVSDILKDQTNLDFMDYTAMVQCGDPEYLNHVLRYMDSVEDGIDIKYIDEEGEIKEEMVRILPSSSLSK